MAEGKDTGETATLSLKDLYQDPSYISLYRYENPNLPYDEDREGIVSKKGLIGSWYTDNLDDLKTYTFMRIKGQKGGRFVVVRVKRDELDKYDATKLPETKDMDLESGNFIIPNEVGNKSRVEVDGVFKDSWEGRQNIPLADHQDIEDYIDKNLSDQTIIASL